MKYLKMFEAITGLFPKMIKVTLLDAATSNLLGTHKIPADKLPAAFNKPITLEINNTIWRILKADPVSADEYLFMKRVTLNVQNADYVDELSLYFSLPTVCGDLPETGMKYLHNDFTLELSHLDWRQIEFRPLHQAFVIEPEIAQINQILDGQPNPLLGYQQQYTREASSLFLLAIPFREFCGQMKNAQLGNIFLNKNGFVINGFALRSDSNTYYGIIENDLIQILCITEFNYVDDEFMQIIDKYELLMVDWCNTNVLSRASDEPDGEESM